jgi:hypothetical protein
LLMASMAAIAHQHRNGYDGVERRQATLGTP